MFGFGSAGLNFFKLRSTKSHSRKIAGGDKGQADTKNSRYVYIPTGDGAYPRAARLRAGIMCELEEAGSIYPGTADIESIALLVKTGAIISERITGTPLKELQDVSELPYRAAITTCHKLAALKQSGRHDPTYVIPDPRKWSREEVIRIREAIPPPAGASKNDSYHRNYQDQSMAVQIWNSLVSGAFQMLSATTDTPQRDDIYRHLGRFFDKATLDELKSLVGTNFEATFYSHSPREWSTPRLKNTLKEWLILPKSGPSPQMCTVTIPGLLMGGEEIGKFEIERTPMPLSASGTISRRVRLHARNGAFLSSRRIVPAVLRTRKDLFLRKTRVPECGGCVLIDNSGSMALEMGDILALLAAAPYSSIAYYQGHATPDGTAEPMGTLTILAEGGRRAHRIPPNRGGGNQVDYESLQWLLAQRGPRVFITDRAFCGGQWKKAVPLFDSERAKGTFTWFKEIQPAIHYFQKIRADPHVKLVR